MVMAGVSGPEEKVQFRLLLLVNVLSKLVGKVLPIYISTFNEPL